jgi:hypothetical protein
VSIPIEVSAAPRVFASISNCICALPGLGYEAALCAPLFGRPAMIHGYLSASIFLNWPTDVPLPIISSSLSVNELVSLNSREITAALQRHFLHVCDVLRKCYIPTDNMNAALLGACIQDYIENAMLKLIETERKRDPDYPATLKVLGQFMKAQGSMMVNQGIPAGLLGISMMNSGIVVALKEMSKDKVVKAIKGSLEGVVTGKGR